MIAKYYSSFPIFKASKGLVLDLGNKIYVKRYLYFPDTIDYRYYIISNLYFGARYIYVGWLGRWLSKEVFYEFIISHQYEKERDAFYKKCASRV